MEDHPLDPTQNPAKPRREKTVWVLQVPFPLEDRRGWADVAVIEVSSNTRRKTAIKQALKQWGGEIPAEGMVVRLIPAADAVEVPVTPKAPEEQQLEIG